MVEGSEALVINLALAGDASGVGGYLGNVTNNSTLLLVPFLEEEKASSSTMRELLVLYKYYVENDISHLRGSNIVHFCDNSGVASIMFKGSG